MKNKRLIASIIVGLIAIIMVLGYAIGTYFVNFALKRGNDTDPLAPPDATCQ